MARETLRADDLAHCAELLRRGSVSFTLASRLLPRAVREAAIVLYAFCRVADDAVDSEPGATAVTVERLGARLDDLYAGSPQADPVDRALAAIVSREQIPRPLLDGLLEGLLWDATGRSYETLEDLYAYAARVAGTVGAMMTVVMGRRAPHIVARACDLGIAMQLTNIARDVGEDAGRGRIYVPLAWLREVGILPEEWLLQPAANDGVKFVVARLLAAADVLYERADQGVSLLPADCRRAVRAARLIYSDIGQEIATRDYDSVTRRAVVPASRKLWLLGRAFVVRSGGRGPSGRPPLPAAQFLVDACAEAE